MAQPYDYAALVGGFQSPEESFVNSIKTVDALRERDRQKKRAVEMQADLQALQTDQSPTAYANFYLKYPEAKEQVEAYRKTLSEADNRFIVDTAQEAFLLNRAGQTQGVLDLFDQRIEALKNSNRPDMIETAKRAKRLYEIAPDQQSRENALGMVLYNYGGGETYEKVWGSAQKPTAFQQDFDFIKKTFGPEAAAEYAQFGRSGIVSIPLGDGRTYVGPPSMAPGASTWKAQGPETPAPSGEAPPQQGEGTESILKNASSNKSITQEEANVVRQSLGPNGQAAFEGWLTKNKIKIIVRTGTAPDGRRVVQYQDGTVEYGAD